MRPLLALLRRLIRALRITTPAPALMLRLLLAGLLLVPMGLLVLLVRLGAAMRGPIFVPATTERNITLRCQLPDLIQMYIWLFDLWEPALTRYIERQLNPGDVFVDVGANVGYFSLLASDIVSDDGSVVAVEASPQTFAALQDNIARNAGAANVHAINRAASDVPQRIPIYRGPGHNLGLSSTVDHQHRALQLECEVHAQPLADMIADLPAIDPAAIRMIKIDVEGGEVAVLAALPELLDQCPETVELLIELSPAWWSEQHLTPREVLQWLFDRGFHPYVLENSYWPWRYLWPNRTAPPQRLPITDDRLDDPHLTRLDLVLSRRDGPCL